MRRLGVLAVAAAVLSGCSGNDDVAPTPTAEPTTTSEAPRPTRAPEVATPTDLAPFRRRTCSLLTPEQTAVLRLPPQDMDGADSETGVCTRRSVPDADARYGLTVLMTGAPLAEAYQNSNARTEDGKYVWEPFEIRTIGGLPAVVKVMGDPSTYCEGIVGTGGRPRNFLTASVAPERADPGLCDRMVTAAEWVVDAARG